jgi:nucleoside-diphosphate-sugar epimerase
MLPPENFRAALKSKIAYRKSMRVLIVGCGYVGLPLGKELVRQDHEVFGLRRSALAEAEMKAAGIMPLHADITQPETLAKLSRDFDWVVNCTASGGGGADDYRKIYLEGNRNLIAWLAGSPLKKYIYTSSTSVYAQNDGSVVTEESPVEPDAATAKVLVETERLLLAAAVSNSNPLTPALSPSGGEREKTKSGLPLNFPAVILRVAGIYGPARGHWFKQFLRGEARIEGDGARWLNMIHRDDLIGVIIAALRDAKPGEIFNAADNEPVGQLKFFEWLAAELKQPMPAMVSTDAEVLRKRGMTNKRISNAKLRAELKYEFQFPDFRAGYAAEIARLNA